MNKQKRFNQYFVLKHVIIPQNLTFFLSTKHFFQQEISSHNFFKQEMFYYKNYLKQKNLIMSLSHIMSATKGGGSGKQMS